MTGKGGERTACACSQATDCAGVGHFLLPGLRMAVLGSVQELHGNGSNGLNLHASNLNIRPCPQAGKNHGYGYWRERLWRHVRLLILQC
jgi:hypothetical protein